MKAVNITLLFDGEADAALNFYKSIFGGEFENFQRMKDLPTPMEMSEKEANKVLHATLPVGNSKIMAMDAPTGRMVLNKGNNFMVTVDTSSEEETTHFFNGLAEGGLITMPLENQFWGAFFGMVTDKFGIQWMLSYVK
jgi:PhnB protein